MIVFASGNLFCWIRLRAIYNLQRATRLGSPSLRASRNCCCEILPAMIAQYSILSPNAENAPPRVENHAIA
uniref:Putative secreted protein n=1 Tax=Panstrongylus lignarius TaxID=156445 RepID=A0A224Y6K6_9HEMI